MQNGVSAVYKARIRGSQFQTVHHQLQHDFIARESVLFQQLPPDNPKNLAPNRAHPVGNTYTVNIRKDLWINRRVCGIGKRANAAAVRSHPEKVITNGVGCRRIVPFPCQKRETYPVTPPLAHLLHTIQRRDQPVGQAMNIFVHHDVGVKDTIHIGSGVGADIHLHAGIAPIGGRRKICIVESPTILGFREYRVTPQPATTKIFLLKVTRGFVKSQLVQPVMDVITGVKQLGHRCRPIGGRCTRKAHWKVEDTIGHPGRYGAGVRPIVVIDVRVGVYIVSDGRIISVIDPAIGRCGFVEKTQYFQASYHGTFFRAWTIHIKNIVGRVFRRHIQRSIGPLEYLTIGGVYHDLIDVT